MTELEKIREEKRRILARMDELTDLMIDNLKQRIALLGKIKAK